MGKSPIAAVSDNATKSAPTSTISARPLYKLSTQDGSPLTPQDQTMLAILAELRGQGYKFKIANLTTQPRTAAILLTGREWK